MIVSKYYMVKVGASHAKARDAFGAPFRTDNAGGLEMVAEGFTYREGVISKGKKDKNGTVYRINDEDEKGPYSLRVGLEAELSLEDAEGCHVVIKPIKIKDVAKSIEDSKNWAMQYAWVCS